MSIRRQEIEYFKKIQEDVLMTGVKMFFMLAAVSSSEEEETDSGR